jgi:UDP-N-acetylmuramate--alanine ligase
MGGDLGSAHQGSGSSSRPTRATAPSSSSGPRSRWSPTSMPTTSITGGRSTPSRQAFDRFLAEATGPTVVCADDPIASRLGHRHGRSASGPRAGVDWSIVDVSVGRGSTRFELVHEGHVISVVSSPSRASTTPATPPRRSRRPTPSVSTRTDRPRRLPATQGSSGASRSGARPRVSPSSTTTPTTPPRWPRCCRPPQRADGTGWSRSSNRIATAAPPTCGRCSPDSFVDADTVWVTELDPAGEAPRPGVSGHLVVEAIVAAHPDADVRWAPDRDRLVDDLVAAAAGRRLPHHRGRRHHRVGRTAARRARGAGRG